MKDKASRIGGEALKLCFGVHGGCFAQCALLLSSVCSQLVLGLRVWALSDD